MVSEEQGCGDYLDLLFSMPLQHSSAYNLNYPYKLVGMSSPTTCSDRPSTAQVEPLSYLAHPQTKDPLSYDHSCRGQSSQITTSQSTHATCISISSFFQLQSNPNEPQLWSFTVPLLLLPTPDYSPATAPTPASAAHPTPATPGYQHPVCYSSPPCSCSSTLSEAR